VFNSLSCLETGLRDCEARSPVLMVLSSYVIYINRVSCRSLGHKLCYTDVYTYYLFNLGLFRDATQRGTMLFLFDSLSRFFPCRFRRFLCFRHPDQFVFAKVRVRIRRSSIFILDDSGSSLKFLFIVVLQRKDKFGRQIRTRSFTYAESFVQIWLRLSTLLASEE